MFDLNLSWLGWLHTAACVVAMLAFLPVIVTAKGGRLHRRSGHLYSGAYAVVCVSSLGILDARGFWFPHWLAVAGLVVLALGYLAVWFKPRGWKPMHLTAMLLSAYNLFGGAVNEAYLRVRPLRVLADDDLLQSQVVGITHGIVMLVFVTLIVGYVTASFVGRRRHGGAVALDRS